MEVVEANRRRGGSGLADRAGARADAPRSDEVTSTTSCTTFSFLLLYPLALPSCSPFDPLPRTTRVLNWMCASM